MRAHLLHEPASPHLERLASHAEFTLSVGATIPPDAEVLVAGRPSRAQLAAAPWKGLVIPYAGLPPATRELLLEAAPDLPVYNQHHNADAVAESVLALLFALAKHVVPMDRALRSGDWRPRYAPESPAVRLAGRSVLVLGYGSIGARVARLLRALGMRVTATRRRADAPSDDGGIVVHPTAHTLDLLPRAEVLVLCLPGTPATEGLLDAAALSRLPRGALLVNVARASITPEDALFAALQQGDLAGAALDVWWRYPDAGARATTPAATLPFHELDNVVHSPHRTGHGPWVEDARYEALATTLLTLARGHWPTDRVDVLAGY